MKTLEELKSRAKELGHLAAEYSRQANQVHATDREQGKMLMRQAYDASKRCQVVIKEILRYERTTV
ncbi:MAG: hypothetical protein KME60_11415 [Cyanomargarita calcarea GSE-NOS-MK-12-04C]|jgi:hypothetical protein|uniref:Uncharacterized protein n=1 Tax=Cyanomargarita calcarea GSE-NOS-MK-12-04C TaxID=2839659 RepID=A0A951URV8_9CYAN|nr:hypothetical protein [Cyanomargarita calcarea GSE-NOS-MK-12-04C]